MIENNENSENSEEQLRPKKLKKPKKPQLSQLVSTFFRNALRSNLDLTSLADTKAGILISINGFILTVSVTASGFAIHNAIMTYAFISIILTSLGSIIFAVLAVKPRSKNKLVSKENLEGYSSLLYYQDMADLAPKEYSKQMNKALFSTKESQEEMITHLHILSAEIKKKYFWLKQAYTFFSLGLIVSAGLIIYALVYVEQTAFYNLSKGNVVYKEDKFYNVFEPSGAATMPDGKVLIVEDESSANSLKLIEVEEDGSIVEIGNLYIPKKTKKIFKKGIEDLEAITSDGNLVYGITSHTLSKSNQRKAAREKLIMFIYEDGAIEDFYIYGDLKNDLYASFPQFFKNTLFATNHLDIEGLCFESIDGNLLIGFRSPVPDGKAMLIGIKNPKEVFLNKQKPRFSTPLTLDLNGMGIRDITFDEQKNGYWIIAGGSNDRSVDFQLWYWDRKNEKLSIVKNQPDIGYGEGITVINKGSKKPALLIVEDNGKKPNKSAEYIIIDRESL
ncbi:DUF3616 domain-containing protein [bacterium]|nr:DUF3616 domain-containing protein [bacterium]MBU1990301.1 DUF3616 domain-containing protein [bacterium]